MPSPWPNLHLSPPRVTGLHYGYEKAGLTIENQPIPWNAEAVLVTAVVRFPPRMRPERKDFALLLGAASSASPPDSFHVEAQAVRVQFRLPTPRQNTMADIAWRGTTISQLTLPILREAEFLQHLSVQMPTVGVVLGEQTVACRAYVASQASGVVASAVLASATSLAPLIDLEPAVEIRTQDGTLAQRLPLTLSGEQLRGRQALASVVLPEPPPKKPWGAAWVVAGRTLAEQPLRPVTRPQLTRSLRLVDARYLVESPDGRKQAVRALPAGKEAARLGPCFVLASAEPGLAGWCSLQVSLVDGAGQTQPIGQAELLISAGPNVLALGTLAASDLENGEAFELRCGSRCLGRLPLAVAPQASFDGEGGFKAVGDFSWSSAAEEELHERLGNLLK